MSLLKAGLVWLMQTQVSKRGGLQRRARGGGVPAVQETRRSTAHAALTGAHAATRQQACFAPRMTGGDRAGGDVFAATQQHVRRSELFEFRTQSETTFN